MVVALLSRRVLLVLLFLLVQAGALAHGIGHLSGHHPHDGDGTHHEPVCELCLAFAAMGAGMASVPTVWLPPEPVFVAGVGVPVSFPTRFQPAYRSRGPPCLNG